MDETMQNLDAFVGRMVGAINNIAGDLKNAIAMIDKLQKENSELKEANAKLLVPKNQDATI